MSSSIEALILLASVTIVWLSWRSWTSMRADIEMDIASAIRGGMFLLIVACALGFVASYFGHQGIARQQDPETYGQAGVLKFPHGIPIHAIQFLPVLVWSLSKLSVPLVWRRQAARLATAGIFVLTLFGAVQTFSGVGRFDLSGPSTLILIIGLCLLIGSVCIPLLRSHRGGEANE